MSEQHEGSSRKEFMAGMALVGAAAATGAGFVRTVNAQEDETITQTATFGVNPEKKEEAREAITKLVTAVQENEPDVLVYTAYFTKDDKVFFFEIYKNQAALEAHGKQPHLAAIRESFMAGILRQPLDVQRLEDIHGYSRM